MRAPHLSRLHLSRLHLPWLPLSLALQLSACATLPVGTGHLGAIVERERGSLLIVDRLAREPRGRVAGLGDLSHASVVFSPDQRYAFVFGRDGGLTKVDVADGKIVARVLQAGNSVGGAISQDGTLVAVSNYVPGGVKIFRSSDLTLVADIPAISRDGKPSKTVGLVDAPGNRFVYSLFEAGEIWVVDCPEQKCAVTATFPGAGKEPYDALITSEGRYYIAGLFGEDGLALLDLWHLDRSVRRVLPQLGKGEQKLPVYKMPHFEGWAVSGGRAFVPGVGRHEVIVLDLATWREVGRIPVAGQPVFAMANPTGRQIWVNFALPDYDRVQVIDTETLQIVQTLKPGKAVLHLEFAPKGDEVWLSVRDENRVEIYRTTDFQRIRTLEARNPSGIFFTPRAHRIGY